MFIAEAPPEAEVVLDEEHDRFVWLPAEEAASRCLPTAVGATVAAVDRRLSSTA